MAKAVIIYGTTTGNTETLAGFVADGLEAAGMDVRVKNVADASPNDLLGYDVIVLGSSTWGNGELQEDFIDFYDKMKDGFLSGKKAAAFGPGDSSYDNFCIAVDMLESKLKECGAEIVVNSLKVDGDVEEAESQTQEWGKQVAGIKRQ